VSPTQSRKKGPAEDLLRIIVFIVIMSDCTRSPINLIITSESPLLVAPMKRNSMFHFILYIRLYDSANGKIVAVSVVPRGVRDCSVDTSYLAQGAKWSTQMYSEANKWIFFPALALQPTFGPWPTSMKLFVSLQFTRSWTFGRGDQFVAINGYNWVNIFLLTCLRGLNQLISTSPNTVTLS
jgi:hypothetical protein